MFSFPSGSALEPADESKWILVSGGVRSEGCGQLLSGRSLVMSRPGERMAVTGDLDLTTAT